MQLKELCSQSINLQNDVLFSFNVIAYLFIDPSSSAIKKFAKRVALEAGMRKVFEIKEFADNSLKEEGFSLAKRVLVFAFLRFIRMSRFPRGIYQLKKPPANEITEP